MRKSALIVLSGSALLLSACGGGGLFNRQRPDEFAVQRQAPLVVPPDFALVPPAPGAPRPTEQSTAAQAQGALFGPAQPRSGVETTVGQKSGQAAPSIRSTVGDPATQTVAKGEVTRDIVAAPEGDGREAQTMIGGT
ncbi:MULTISPECIES: DUF3035 domain-containing protein [unclassified Novosphingobium]|uniref:DUF3035 domain-containing protein n=1 Tax=unclassified Novosphingobium TaxID=2644732 RepID=UPI000EEF2B13|nr:MULTISPECIES: DUF3035 domain-containing protein [unclassified Novosphingobium]HCF24252.1 DUF3035 domain-containing protein [Novosphingobium sp.]HQV02500.1 DUF3035 domain-containing protein [Novosphingobium sp.]